MQKWQKCITNEITIFGCTSLNMADVNSVMSKDARFSLLVRSHSIAICAENLSQNTIKHLSEYYLSEFFMLAFLYKYSQVSIKRAARLTTYILDTIQDFFSATSASNGSLIE